MLESLKLKSLKGQVTILYFAAIVVRAFAFIRYYALSHYFGANDVTDLYLLYLLILESLANVLVSNHALTLLMRNYRKKDSLLKKDSNYLLTMVSGFALLAIGLVDFILGIFMRFSFLQIVFVSVISYFFVMSIAMLSVLNFLHFFEAAAYQDLVGQLVLLLGIIGGHRIGLFGSLLAYALFRFLLFYRYLYNRGYIPSMKNLVLEALRGLRLFVKDKRFQEYFLLLIALLLSTLSALYQAYLIRGEGAGIYTAFGYAQRVIRAVSALVIAPILPVIARHLIEYKRRVHLFKRTFKKYLIFFTLVLLLMTIFMLVAGYPLLKFFLLHGAFTEESLQITLKFYYTLLITIFSFNLMTLYIQVTLVFKSAFEVFWAYLWATLAFTLMLSMYRYIGGIIVAQVYAYLFSGIIFVVYLHRAIMKVSGR